MLLSNEKTLRILAVAGILLASVVVVLGAYTRLVDAGLGCPDWPGCYGFIGVPQSAEQIAEAESRFPDAPVEVDKAWPEMVHRYFATGLGMLALAILAVAYRRRAALTVPIALTVLVIVQGAFGAWTVTLKLWPQVVTAHLLGGFATLGVLSLYAMMLGALKVAPVSRTLRRHAAWALAFLVLQVALGGWVTSNYAALACADFPTCHGDWLPEMDIADGFNVLQDVGPNYLGGLMTSEARVAIQMAHRIGAFVVVIALGWLGFRVARESAVLGWSLLGLLAVQFALGVTNVLASLPLAVATLHNAGGAALLVALIAVNFAARPREGR